MKMKPLKLPKMSTEDIDELLNGEKICRIAFRGGDYPYIAPFQYVRIGKALYFHFTDYGKKIKLLEKDNKVCVSVENLNSDMSEYRFLVLRGELDVVENGKERTEVIRKLADAGRRELSENFLVAHGFSSDGGWDSLSEEKPMVIVKLERVNGVVGLRSPP